jgi:hypothetical protein
VPPAILLIVGFAAMVAGWAALMMRQRGISPSSTAATAMLIGLIVAAATFVVVLYLTVGQDTS